MPSIQQHIYSNSIGMKIIAIIKLVSAALLLALTFGIYHLLGRDVGDTLEQYVRRLHFDMENHFITRMIAKASGVTARDLRRAGTVTFIYAILYVIEGVGLLLNKHWAEYLTIVITGLLIPLEVYEIALKLSPVRIIILVVNLAIVVYLIYRLRSRKRSY